MTESKPDQEINHEEFAEKHNLIPLIINDYKTKELISLSIVFNRILNIINKKISDEVSPQDFTKLMENLYKKKKTQNKKDNIFKIMSQHYVDIIKMANSIEAEIKDISKEIMQSNDYNPENYIYYGSFKDHDENKETYFHGIYIKNKNDEKSS